MEDTLRMEDTLNLSPFPALKWNGYFWEASIILSAWAGFQSRGGAYTSVDSLAVSDGAVTLYVMTPDNEPSPPAPEQANAFEYLVEQQDAMRDAILQAIFAEYPSMQDLYGDDAEDADEVMPDIENTEQLKAMIGLSIVHVRSPSDDGVSNIGFEFGCIWDEEHGLGVLTKAGQVVEVGQSDILF